MDFNPENFGELFLRITNTERAILCWKGKGSFSSWKENPLYKYISGYELKTLVYSTAISLGGLNVKPGDKVAIISESRWEWVVADFACILNQLVTVPVYTSISAEQIEYILNHSESTVCFVSNKMILDKILSIKNNLKSLKYIVSFNETDYKDIINFNSLIKKNETKESIDVFIKSKSGIIKKDDLLTIIYTSGTTGNPKGVCLTHKNILSNIRSCLKVFELGESDIFLSYLPLAHGYERTAGYYLALSCGGLIVYAQNIDALGKQFKEVKPTIVTTVPLLFNRMYSRIIKSSESFSFFKKKIFNTGLSLAEKYKNNKKHFLWKVADKLVLKKIRSGLGDRLRFFASGGSTLNIDIANKFDAFGINILEGYGMTEASPVISVNRLHNKKFGTVGLPLDGVDVKIETDGEITVKGDNVMSSYYKDPVETANTIINGWLHTGDIGEIDNEGRLVITDRKKSLIKTEGGKYISLTHVEETAGSSKYISQIAAIALDKPFVTALIVPEFDELKKEFNEENLETGSDFMIKFFEKILNDNQKTLAKYERIRKFRLISEPFTIENSMMTPTLKIKRNAIESRYKKLIEEMYVKI